LDHNRFFRPGIRRELWANALSTNRYSRLQVGTIEYDFQEASHWVYLGGHGNIVFDGVNKQPRMSCNTTSQQQFTLKGGADILKSSADGQNESSKIQKWSHSFLAFFGDAFPKLLRPMLSSKKFKSIQMSLVQLGSKFGLIC
jgi:hypothetical protein